MVTKAEFIELMKASVREDTYKWLSEMGFFEAPASISHHGNKKGGLFIHSKEVMIQLLNLTEKLNLQWQLARSPYIVGMFHDICKADNYKKTASGSDTDNDGLPVWAYNNAPLLTGHGEKSVIMLQQHMMLTEEEMLCIRWHMGAFDDKNNWNSYGLAVAKYPNVLYTHTADMIAARITGV